MKKLYFLFLIELIFFSIQAQTITAFSVVPANPTTIDTIIVYVQTDFAQSPCEGETYLTGISGSDINAGGLHCMGNIMTPCTDFDTVIIPPQPPGSYTLHYMLTTGTTSGCIFGIIPLMFDSTHFTVSLATSIGEPDKNNSIQITPNPISDYFIIKQNSYENSVVNIYSIDGKIAGSWNTKGKETKIDIALSPGIYLVKIHNTKGDWISKLVLK